MRADMLAGAIVALARFVRANPLVSVGRQVTGDCLPLFAGY